ncbi:hypothetical protein CBS101457_006650 [Exobasidium rhododendri]|nr:hypothetical protein CBS101457_006650 [Exobasidium rhododendri]
MSSLSAGTPSTIKKPLEMLSASPERSQYRNATRNGVQKKMRNTTTTIEISDSDPDDVEPPPESSKFANNPANQEAGSSSPKTKRLQTYANQRNNIAYVPNPIRRKSESPTDTFRTAEQGKILVRDSQGDGKDDNLDDQSPPELDNRRSFNILNDSPALSQDSKTTYWDRDESDADVFPTEGHSRSEPKKLQNSMRGRDGKVKIVKPILARRNLGSSVHSSLNKKPIQPDDVASASTFDRQNSPMTIRQLDLRRIGFFGVGALGDLTRSSIVWNPKGEFSLQWRKGKFQSDRFTFLPKDVAELGYSTDATPATMTITPRQPDRVSTDLLRLFCNTKGAGRAKRGNDEIVLIFQGRDGDFDTDAWHSLISTFKDNLPEETVSSYYRNASFMQVGEVEKLKDLSSHPEEFADMFSIRETNGTTRPRPRPTQTFGATLPFSDSHRRAERQRSPDKEFEEATTSLEASTKPAATPVKDGSVQRLRYPFESKSGAVTLFQSDIDKLDEGEFLNDTIIDFGLKYLLEEVKVTNSTLYSEIYVFSSFFYKRFNERKQERKRAYENVKKWTAKVNIFDKKYLVIPINEKVHWYLAIVVNPYYAVKQVEKRKGLCCSSGEEGKEEEEGEWRGQIKGGRMEHQGDGVLKEDRTEGETDVCAPPDKDTEGDVQMDEAKSVAAERKEKRRDESALEGAESAESPFKRVSSAELEESYISRITLPVLDLRRGTGSVQQSPQTPNMRKRSTALTRSGSEDDGEVEYLRSSKRSTTRPGISDGISNAGRGSLRGGGGGDGVAVVIRPGESFAKVSPKRIVSSQNYPLEEGDEVDEEVIESSLSPLRQSRSGKVYGGELHAKSSTKLRRKLSTEDLNEKHREMLQTKAVVCLFDSLGGTHRAVKTALQEYFSLEYNDKMHGETEPANIDLDHIDVSGPMQDNFCDCGLYLLHSFERFIHDPERVLKEIIPSRNKTHSYWQVDEAKAKRKWWKRKVNELATEWGLERDKVKAEKEARKEAERLEAKSKPKEPGKGGTSDSVRSSRSSSSSSNKEEIVSSTTGEHQN